MQGGDSSRCLDGATLVSIVAASKGPARICSLSLTPTVTKGAKCSGDSGRHGLDARVAGDTLAVLR